MLESNDLDNARRAGQRRAGALAALSLCLPVCVPLAGCGGDTSEPRPTAASTSDVFDSAACDADAHLEFQSIEDFEKGVALDFWGNNDGSEGSEVTPSKAQKSPLSATIDGGRCDVSDKAYHLTAQGLTDWGAVFGLNFVAGSVDASAWDGLSFWARRGPSSKPSLFFSISEPQTDPSGGTCVSETDDLTEKCDQFGVGIGLDEQWRFYRVPFGAMKQRGFGVAAPEPNVSAIIGFSWAMDIGDWDVWIDDVALYRAAR